MPKIVGVRNGAGHVTRSGHLIFGVATIQAMLWWHAQWLADPSTGRRANFFGVSLDRYVMRGLDLRKVVFDRASLWRTDFDGADLSGTCLDPRASFLPSAHEEIRAAGFYIHEKDGEEIVRGVRTLFSSVRAGGHEYTPGWHEAPVFSVSDEPCHPGIYMASSRWMREHYAKETRLVGCWAYRDELLRVGDKWRARRIFVEEDE